MVREANSWWREESKEKGKEGKEGKERQRRQERQRGQEGQRLAGGFAEWRLAAEY